MHVSHCQIIMVISASDSIKSPKRRNIARKTALLGEFRKLDTYPQLLTLLILDSNIDYRQVIRRLVCHTLKYSESDSWSSWFGYLRVSNVKSHHCHYQAYKFWVMRFERNRDYHAKMRWRLKSSVAHISSVSCDIEHYQFSSSCSTNPFKRSNSRAWQNQQCSLLC